MPLQSLVLLPPLQRPMLPQARLPLMRHGGRGSAGAEEGRSADRALSVHLQAGKKKTISNSVNFLHNENHCDLYIYPRKILLLSNLWNNTIDSRFV